MLPVLFSVLHPELPVQVRFPTLPYPLQLTGHPESFLLSDPEEPVFRENFGGDNWRQKLEEMELVL